MIHLYEGDGKGKTTCAYGLALRMTGSGGSVGIAGFFKPVSSGEYKAVNELFQNARIEYFGGENGFYKDMSEELKKKTSKEIRDGFFGFVAESFDLLVLDEITYAVSFGIIGEDELIKALEESPSKEIVLTGRDPSEKIKAAADYHTFFKKIKHPFDNGTVARRGIEY